MKPVNIQLIRNATLKINYNGKTILVDPMFSPKHQFMSFVEPDKNLNPTLDLPLPIEEITEGVDTLLVTHTHPDHLDPLAVQTLDHNLPTYVQPCDKDVVSGYGFNDIKAVEDVMTFDGIEVTRTTGHHGPQEILEHLGEVSGFVLKAQDHPTIYIVGDCLWEDVIQEAIDTHQPDIIITNSGGATFMGQHTILMDAEATVNVSKYAPKATVVAVHMEALDHCQTTRQSVRDVASKEQLNIHVPQDGETLVF